MKPITLSLFVTVVAACHGASAGAGDAAVALDAASADGGPHADLSPTEDLSVQHDLGVASAADLALPADLPDLAGPSETDCFYSAGTVGGCPAPVVTAAYLGSNCEGTTGVFVVGSGFEFTNTYQEGVGILPIGPTASFSNGPSSFWNWLTPTAMCLTTSASASTWSGFSLTVTNPDGKVSNAVTVADELGSDPLPPSTGSNDPFDLDACLDPEMTSTTAVGHIAMGASSATLTTLPISVRTRSCNELTGCSAFGAATPVASAAAVGIAISGNLHVSLSGTDCGTIVTQGALVLPFNECEVNGVEYLLHMADHCTTARATVFSTPDSAHDYTETEYAGVARY